MGGAMCLTRHGLPYCIKELGSIQIYHDPVWLGGNYFVWDAETRNFESFECYYDAMIYALKLQARKVEIGHPSRFGTVQKS